jgi:hypothetical protein
VEHCVVGVAHRSAYALEVSNLPGMRLSRMCG